MYIKLSHIVCEPHIVCDLSRWTLEAACKFVAFKNITSIIGKRRPFVCLYFIVFDGFRRNSVLGVDTKDGILECDAV